MKTVHKSVLIWYSAEEMFNLVTDIAKYPEFLPWCDKAAIVSRDGDDVTAEVGIALGGLHQSFVTRNTHIPGREVTLQLIKGPFSHLQGLWRFVPLDASAARACRVELTLKYSFNSMALPALVGPVFDRIAASMVDAFVQRAEKVYAET